MIEIKAFVQRNRAAAVIRALKRGEFSKISVIDVKGMLMSLDKTDQQYSAELDEGAFAEVKLELVCEEERLSEVVALVRNNALTGLAESGRIYVSKVVATVEI